MSEISFSKNQKFYSFLLFFNAFVDMKKSLPNAICLALTPMIFRLEWAPNAFYLGNTPNANKCQLNNRSTDILYKNITWMYLFKVHINFVNHLKTYQYIDEKTEIIKNILNLNKIKISIK